MTQALRLGIAGLGTVGAGVLDILARHKDLVAARAGRPIEVVAVSARSRGKDRGHDLSKLAWHDDPVKLAADPSVDVFVELMGGEGDPAKSAVETAIRAGKHVITANKALLAHHGSALARLAEAQGVAHGGDGHSGFRENGTKVRQFPRLSEGQAVALARLDGQIEPQLGGRLG